MKLFFNSKWVVPAAALTLFWVIEIFLIQEYTLDPKYPYNETKWLVSRGIRFFLDFLFCILIISFSHRLFLYVIFILTIIGSAVLTAYYEYFVRSLSLNTIIYQLKEGAQTGEFAIHLMNGWIVFALCLGFVTKIILYEKIKNVRPKLQHILVPGILCLILYLSTIVGINHFIDPLRKLQTFASVGRMGITYGYMVTWLGELWYLDNDKLLARAVKTARTETYDRLTPVEYPLRIKKDLVIIQMESLEFAILDYYANGQPVTPFLNQLKEKSFFYKISAIHINGSADADFTALTGLMPSPDTVTYKIKNYPYTETLARLARKKGFASYAFHGASGYFFNRRYGFEQMGFDDFYFREELARDFGLKQDRWGVKDHDVLDLSLRLLKEKHDQKILHFIITLTSHGPWIFLSKDEMKIFNNPENIQENYINSMEYLDHELKVYISNLPKDTIVLLYGDHESKVDYTKNNKGPTSPQKQEWVPCFIYKVDNDLAQKQATRNLKISTSGELNLLDVITYLRACINR